jgi:hypothetical protein
MKHKDSFNVCGISFSLLELQEVCKFLVESTGSGTGTPELLYYVSSAWKSLALCGSLPVSNIVKVSVKQYVTVDKLSELTQVLSSNLDQDISCTNISFLFFFLCGFYQSLILNARK